MFLLPAMWSFLIKLLEFLTKLLECRRDISLLLQRIGNFYQFSPRQWLAVSTVIIPTLALAFFFSPRCSWAIRRGKSSNFRKSPRSKSSLSSRRKICCFKTRSIELSALGASSSPRALRKLERGPRLGPMQRGYGKQNYNQTRPRLAIGPSICESCNSDARSFGLILSRMGDLTAKSGRERHYHDTMMA